MKTVAGKEVGPLKFREGGMGHSELAKPPGSGSGVLIQTGQWLALCPRRFWHGSLPRGSFKAGVFVHRFMHLVSACFV